MSITFTPGWVDITTYVRAGSKPIDITRGKQHELSRIETSTMDLTVTSTDDRFNPKNTAGAYYPHVTPTTPIRAVALYEGTDEHLWRGYVKGWPQRWTHSGKVSAIKLKCYDVFGIFARTLMRDYQATVLGNSPVAWWSAATAESPTGLMVDHSGNGHDITWNSGPSGQNASVPLMFLDDIASHQSVDQWGTVADDAAFRLDGNRSLEAWIWLHPDNDGAGAATIMSIAKYLSSEVVLYRLGFAIAGGNRVTVHWGYNGSVSSTLIDETISTITNPSDADAHWMHIVTTWNEAAKRGRLYVNGSLVQESIFGGVTAAVAGTQVFEFGRSAESQSEEFGSGVSANYWSEAAVYDQELQEGAIRSLYDNRISPYGFVDGVEWWYYFPMVGWPVGASVLDVGDDANGYLLNWGDGNFPPAGAGQLSGALDSSLFAEIRRMADNWNASYFVDTRGRVVHHTYASRKRTFGTPVAAYTDDGTGLGYRELVMPQDNTLIRNIWEVTPDSGATQRVLDQDSIDIHGPKTQKIDDATYSQTNVVTSEQDNALARARMGLAATKDAHTRVDRLRIQPGGFSEQWDALFKLDLLRRVTVERTPPGGSIETNDLVIQRMKFRIVLDRSWTLDLQLSPTENDDYWILGTDTLGVSTKLGW